METRINIAEILRNKPHGIKLYSPIFGDCTYCYIHDETSDICVRRPYNKMSYFNFEGLYNTAGECLLFPSKEMRDWSKFEWKKGNILVSDNGKVEVIFEKFIDNTYQSFIGKHHLDNLEDNLYYQDEGEYLTSIFSIESEDAAQTYVKTLEEKLGGKLNRETLEIEKQSEFKDGDIVTMHKKNCDIVFIFNRLRTEGSFYYYAFHTLQTNNTGVIDCHITLPYAWTFFGGKMNFATDSEKQQLFDALAKKGKAWDAEKKQIVNLKPKCEFKPFDKVLGRNGKGEVWEAELFSHYREELQYPFRCIGFNRKYCIPYNEETAHLLGTTDDWEE